MTVKICNICVMPNTFPGIRFNGKGVCNFCQERLDPVEISKSFNSLRDNMSSAIESWRNSSGDNEYDCIVAYSGGKDSTYTLKLLVKKYKLRCLAVTIDNGFMSEQARKNCDVVTSSLNVDYVVIKPAANFMNNMYLQSVMNPQVHAKSAIKRASNLCNSCINLINLRMISCAIEHDAPMIAGGYIGGQVPKDSAMIEIDIESLSRMRATMESKYVLYFGSTARQYMQLPKRLLSKDRMKKALILNPMLTVQKSEEEIIADISELGWIKTLDTGKNSSNCRLNDLGIAVHHKQYGFNTYVLEIS